MIFTETALTTRRNNVQRKWDSLLGKSDAVLIFCGAPLQKPGGLDQTYPFLAHPMYLWLTGESRANGVVLYSVKTGWVDFIKPITLTEKLWENVNESIRPGKDVAGLENFLKENRFEKIVCLGQPELNLTNASADFVFEIKKAIDQVRRIKDEEEITLISRAASSANLAYIHIDKILRPGLSERDIQIEFEAEVQRTGAGLPYETIVGTGSNSATLHAVPTARILAEDDLVLIDAGAHHHDYCVDITRVFHAGRKFNSQQQNLFDLIKKAHNESVAMALPGTEWRDVHMHSAKIIAEGLKSFGLVKGSVDDFIESLAISAFYPHGVGHLVGLRVRDVGYEENLHPKKYAGANLRVDLKLEKGLVLTVEPGCYFIPAYIENDEIRKKYADHVNWAEVEKWKTLGGVRLEDDILIQESKPRNLTGHVLPF